MRLPLKIAAILGLALSLAVIISSLLILPLSDMIATQVFHTSTSSVWYVLFKVIIILTLVVAPLGITIWLTIMKLIVQPVLDMSEATKSTAGGNYGVRIKFKSDDEIGVLATSLNQLFQHSAEAFQGMANGIRDIKKRERELAVSLQELQKTHQSLEEEKLKLQEAKSQDEAILTSIDNGVVAIDQHGKVILFNWAASVITGFANPEVVGRDYKEVLSFHYEKDLTNRLDFIDKALKGQKQPPQYHSIVFRKDRSQVPVTNSASPIFGPKGEIMGAVVAFSDATKERQLEKLKDEFVSIASHELRTPMTAIKGMLSMILDGDYGPVNQDQKEPLTDIMTSTDRLISLVNDLLNVSRIEAGRMKYDLTTFTLEPAVAEAVTMLSILTKKKGIELIKGEIVTNQVYGDLDKVKQVLNNLLGNSYKFTDQGSITISTKVEGELVKIFVTDTGIGIKSEDQGKLFAKFQQVSTQQTGRPAGTGLGLYLSRELMRKMGGDLWIEKAELGKGSTFAFSVPLAGSHLAEKVKQDLEKPNS